MVFSPLYVFIGDLAPATAANWEGFVLEVDVKFNVPVVALAVPRIPTSFSHFCSHLTFCDS